MNQIYTDGATQHILKINRGEEVITQLRNYCEQNLIYAGWIQALGAVDQATFSYYDLEKKEYIKNELHEECELLSLIGNIALLNGEVTVHGHIVLGRKDYSVIGGHVHSMRVSGTCEIMVTCFQDGSFERKKDEETGLNLLK